MKPFQAIKQTTRYSNAFKMNLFLSASRDYSRKRSNKLWPHIIQFDQIKMAGTIFDIDYMRRYFPGPWDMSSQWQVTMVTEYMGSDIFIVVLFFHNVHRNPYIVYNFILKWKPDCNFDFKFNNYFVKFPKTLSNFHVVSSQWWHIQKKKKISLKNCFLFILTTTTSQLQVSISQYPQAKLKIMCSLILLHEILLSFMGIKTHLQVWVQLIVPNAD